jgi:hypothetical protein
MFFVTCYIQETVWISGSWYLKHLGKSKLWQFTADLFYNFLKENIIWLGFKDVTDDREGNYNLVWPF